MVAERWADLPTIAEIHAERARRHLKDFIAQAWHVVEPETPYLANWHIDAICLHLEALLDGVVTRMRAVPSRSEARAAATERFIRNLLVNMPPRMMKSLTISVFFPAWVWIEYPWLRFLYCSYSQTLATEHSMLTRRVIESDWYQRNWGDRFTLSDDDNLKTRFTNDKRGARLSTSVGGTVTGQGGDIIVSDDPHNVKQAESEPIRLATISWWDQVMSTRFNNPKAGARIIVMQRVHEHDLSGHVLEQGGYEHLCLPMEHETPAQGKKPVTSIGWSDPRTEDGELLAPERFGPAEVVEAKKRLGSYGYAGQMQQRPSPAGGGIFKRHWWRFWQHDGMNLPPVIVKLESGALFSCPVVTLPTVFDKQTQSWDMAFKDKAANSYVVGQVWGKSGASKYLLDQFRDHVNFPNTLAAVRLLTASWPKAIEKLVESKANGPAVIDTLGNEIPGMIPIEPEGGKEVRAHAVSPQVEAGNVILPHPHIAPWVNDFIKECGDFPNGDANDQVDGMSQYLHKIESQSANRVISESYIDGDEPEQPARRRRTQPSPDWRSDEW